MNPLTCMKKKIEHFVEVWKLPLHRDENSSVYAWSDNGVMALTFATDDGSLIDAIIDRINDKACEISGKWERSGTTFYRDGKCAFIVRGWGHLVGGGALRLPQKEAARIQDEFCDYILEQLTASVKTIRCPNCGKVQKALVRHTPIFDDFTHHCDGCDYWITESEWEEAE